jgi:uncharacterized protein (TIGR02246 family)
MLDTKVDIKTVVHDLCDGVMRNVTARDAAALADGFYTDDAILLPPGAPMIRGRDRIRDFWAKLMADGLTGLRLDTLDVIGDGSMAYEVGQFEMTVQQDGPPQQVGGKYMVVFRRGDDGAWRAAADMFNADS